MKQSNETRQQKVNTVLHLRGKTIDHERVEAEKEINQPNKDKDSTSQ